MDDMSRKINDFLSDPASMEKIRGLMGMLGVSPDGSAGPQPGNGAGGPPPVPAAPASPINSGGNPAQPGGVPDMPLDPAMILNLKRAFDLMHTDDPRIALLLALKPNLSGDRRQRVDEAIQLMRLIHLIPLLREGFLPTGNSGGGLL